jgi:23S rRNA pseudouridine2605 synthase
MKERINKVLSTLGYGSRREIDRFIAAGAVLVNGRKAELGERIVQDDEIFFRGQKIFRQPPKRILIAFHKPKGVVSTRRDPHARRTVMNFLPPRLQHLYPIGRLDKMSRGLLLLTNNGPFALELSHPRFEHEKEYEVVLKIQSPKTTQAIRLDLNRLEKEIVVPAAQSKPIRILDFFLHPDQQFLTVRLLLEEGKKRQIRRLFESLGYHVIDLIRLRIGRFSLDDLHEGEYRDITPPGWQ